jgi:glycosyltransferase involved in cell wall biosynthesis
MKVLVVAPQPFFQERGTPIAVKLAVESLARQLPSIDGESPKVDLLVYNEGTDIEIAGVNIIRAKTPAFLRGVRPGISCRKLACDVFMFFHFMSLLIRSRANQYDVIHAVEESVFFAWIAKKIFRIPYIYDMDSSLALQLTERWWWCKPVLSILQSLERLAVRGSIAVAPVCDALQVIAASHGSVATVLLRDVSLLPKDSVTPKGNEKLELFGEAARDRDPLILYVGNLESYQGIDLLVESFSKIHTLHPKALLIIVGGTPRHIEHYAEKTKVLKCSESVLFLGPRPVDSLVQLLTSADILVSPRTKGNNTPMKIYSYLHSGTPLLATDLPTHTQVLDNSISMLAQPNSEDFSAALARLISDPVLRKKLGEKAKVVSDELYTVEAFEKQIAILYTRVLQQIDQSRLMAARTVGNL